MTVLFVQNHLRACRWAIISFDWLYSKSFDANYVFQDVGFPPGPSTRIAYQYLYYLPVPLPHKSIWACTYDHGAPIDVVWVCVRLPCRLPRSCELSCSLVCLRFSHLSSLIIGNSRIPKIHPNPTTCTRICETSLALSLSLFDSLLTDIIITSSYRAKRASLLWLFLWKV
jgi:hypothetical protein